MLFAMLNCFQTLFSMFGGMFSSGGRKIKYFVIVLELYSSMINSRNQYPGISPRIERLWLSRIWTTNFSTALSLCRFWRIWIISVGIFWISAMPSRRLLYLPLKCCRFNNLNLNHQNESFSFMSTATLSQ